MDARQQAELDALNLAIDEAGGVPCAGDDLMIAEEESDQVEGTHWCTRCPVTHQCRSYGLAWPAEQGVYGGLSQGERKRLTHPQKPAQTPEELRVAEEHKKELSRERSRRARARRKQRQEGAAA